MQLEALVEAHGRDESKLREIHAELKHRKTSRAVKLREEVVRVLGELSAARQAPTPEDRPAPSRDLNRSLPPRPAQQRAVRPTSVTPDSSPPDDGSPRALIDAWTALEVLDPPQAFNDPNELAMGDGSIVRIDQTLPWEGAGERSRKNKRLYYHVVLGELDLPVAYEALLARFADSAPDRPSPKKSAALAVITCDQKGRLATESLVLSSFAWGLPIALTGDLKQLSGWRSAERRIVEALSRRMRREDREQPVTRQELNGAFRWLAKELGLASQFIRPPSFAIRDYQYMVVHEPPDPPLLNSFFLGDLARARTAVERGSAPPSLQRYLGITSQPVRHDVLRDARTLVRMLAPASTPPARWPAPRRAPLVPLQQAAVNAVKTSNPGDIVAVNGPPGTGKTTLLRDVVASVVTARAEVLATFEDPEQAFSFSGVTVTRKGAQLRLQTLEPKLRGFELVVASSNNKAVENVSAEVPSLGAIADDLPNLRYFASVATALREDDSWGLIAGVLGNSSNRYRFQTRFWEDEDSGLETYLAAASGTPRMVELAPGQSRLPKVVEQEKPPSGHTEAIARWRVARETFRAALKASRSAIAAMQRIHELESEVLDRRTRLETLTSQHTDAKHRTEDKAQALSAALVAATHARTARDGLKAAEAELRSRRPPFFARVFKAADARPWLAESQEFQARHAAAAMAVAQAEAAAGTARRAHDQALAEVRALAEALPQEQALLSQAQRLLESSCARLEVKTGSALLAAGHAERHLAVAWFDEKAQRARDDVFVAAMGLHRAFIDAAATPLRHNISGLMRQLWTGVPGATPELVRDLWASLFLVVPLVSTTFASVETMLGSLPDSSVGWLLIDEAGQASPQSAVGAVMRAEHVVVVGDPMQVEPVVMLPESLTAAVCARFGIDPVTYAAPSASVQTLADRASPVVATFETQAGSRSVGIPLLVHRRCSEPMFGISNSIAYENLMVHAKAPRESVIGSVLGPSRWIHVKGRAQHHWCPEEGTQLLELLAALARQRVSPDLYIVTPFRAVAAEVRQMVLRSGVLNPVTDARSFTKDRVGTIHTVQGREAEAVIFLLGCPDPKQSGARTWAGERPNLLNVAVTRAKERLYVIGNRDLWRTAGIFKVLDRYLGD